MGKKSDGARTHAGIVLAAGTGTRVGHSRNKVYLPLGGRRILIWSLAALARAPGVGRLLLAVRDKDEGLAREVLAEEVPELAVDVVVGGATRHESEYRTLLHLADEIRGGVIDVVLIHDAARPLASDEMIGRVLRAAKRGGAAVPGVPAEGLLGVDLAGRLASGSGGDGSGGLVTVQTPQAFRAGPLLAAYAAAAGDGFTGSDTAACVERYTEVPVQVVPGDPGNLKVTFPDDLFIAERLLAAQTRAPGHRSRGSQWSMSISSF